MAKHSGEMRSIIYYTLGNNSIAYRIALLLQHSFIVLHCYNSIAQHSIAEHSKVISMGYSEHSVA